MLFSSALWVLTVLYCPDWDSSAERETAWECSHQLQLKFEKNKIRILEFERKYWIIWSVLLLMLIQSYIVNCNTTYQKLRTTDLQGLDFDAHQKRVKTKRSNKKKICINIFNNPIRTVWGKNVSFYLIQWIYPRMSNSFLFSVVKKLENLFIFLSVCYLHNLKI